MSLHFFEFILPKEYMYTCGKYVDKILGLEFCLNCDLSGLHYTQEFKLPSPTNIGWGEPTYTLVSWMQGFRHPTRNECMGWFARINYHTFPCKVWRIVVSNNIMETTILRSNNLTLSSHLKFSFLVEKLHFHLSLYKLAWPTKLPWSLKSDTNPGQIS